MDTLPYIVWNPANLKKFNRPSVNLLKPQRQPILPQVEGKPRILVNYPFTTEL